MERILLKDYGIEPNTGKDCSAVFQKIFTGHPGMRYLYWSQDVMSSGRKRP